MDFNPLISIMSCVVGSAVRIEVISRSIFWLAKCELTGGNGRYTYYFHNRDPDQSTFRRTMIYRDFPEMQVSVTNFATTPMQTGSNLHIPRPT